MKIQILRAVIILKQENKISPLDISFFSSFLYRTFYIIGGFNLIIGISKSSSIISVIINFFIGYILLLSYFYINNRDTDSNIFKKIDKCFPKIISSFLNILLIVFTFFICSFVLYNMLLFINYNLLDDIDLIPIGILLIATLIYIVSKGINTIIRVGGILIFFFLLLAILSIISLIPYSNPTNIYPLIGNNFMDVTKSSIYYSMLSLMPIFYLLIIPKSNIERNKVYKRYMIITYVVSSIYLLISIILTLSILGVELTSILNYPDIIVLKKISLLNFIERVEDILSFKLMFEGFLFLSIGIFYMKEGIINTFKIKKINHKITFAIGILLLIISLYLRLINIVNIIYFLIGILLIHLILMIFIKREET